MTTFIGRTIGRRFYSISREKAAWLVVFPAGILVGMLGWSFWSRNDVADSDFIDRFRGGSLMIAGGGDLPAIVNQRFWELAGRKDGRLVIIPAYHATRNDIQRLKAEWKNWPFKSIRILQAADRDAAEDPDFAAPLARADAVWFSGGEQSWLANLYADTPVEGQLQALLDRGGIIGGTSAGASIMTRVMIEEGNRQAKLNRGLDLLKDSVVDQHFFHRNRPQRLIGAVRDQPNLIGFGIDEGTALIVQLPSGRLEVIGKSYVMACISHEDGSGPRLEILKPGDLQDLDGLRDRFEDEPIAL